LKEVSLRLKGGGTRHPRSSAREKGSLRMSSLRSLRGLPNISKMNLEAMKSGAQRVTFYLYQSVSCKSLQKTAHKKAEKAFRKKTVTVACNCRVSAV